MGLIYKPNALYMTPKNESVDITNGVDFSFVFKGYKMTQATGQLYQNSNIGEWTPIGNTFDFISDNTIYYNNQNIQKSIASGSVYNTLTSNVNSILGWGVTVYGMPSTQTASANNTMTPTLRGFETGDMVATYTGSNTDNPYNYTYIASYDSKLTLGNVNTGTDAEGTDLTDTFTVPEAVYINLTSGDAIKENISATTYYLHKMNEGATDPVGYYVRFYTTQADAESGTGTAVSGSTLANKSYYVNPVNATSNIFYVGVIGGNVVQLYTTKEAALQGVEDAIVPLTSGSTYTIQAFEKSQIVQFTPILLNAPYIDDDDLYATNVHITLTVDPTDDDLYTYSGAQTLYTGQRIISNTGDIYYVYVWDETNAIISLYQTREAAFNHNSIYITAFTGSYAYLGEVMNATQDFVVQWTDTTDIPLIMSWQAALYNVNVDSDNNIIDRNLIEESSLQYNADVQYQFSHLLLSCLSNIGEDYNDSLGRYEVVFTLTDNTGYVYTCSNMFDVGYNVADIVYSPYVTVDNCDSSVTVDWKNALSVQGTYTGTAPQYRDNYLYDGNIGAQIAANSTMTFETDIPPASFPTFLFQPSNGFNGTIITLDGDQQSAVLSYDSVRKIFNFAVTNKNSQSTINNIVNTEVTDLSSSMVYLIGYAEGQVYIREYSNI